MIPPRHDCLAAAAHPRSSSFLFPVLRTWDQSRPPCPSSKSRQVRPGRGVVQNAAMTPVGRGRVRRDQGPWRRPRRASDRHAAALDPATGRGGAWRRTSSNARRSSAPSWRPSSNDHDPKKRAPGSLVDSITPPALMLGWADPWLDQSEVVGGCRLTGHLAVVAVAGRLSPGDGIAVLEGLVQYVLGPPARQTRSPGSSGTDQQAPGLHHGLGPDIWRAASIGIWVGWLTRSPVDDRTRTCRQRSDGGWPGLPPWTLAALAFVRGGQGSSRRCAFAGTEYCSSAPGRLGGPRYLQEDDGLRHPDGRGRRLCGVDRVRRQPRARACARGPLRLPHARRNGAVGCRRTIFRAGVADRASIDSAGPSERKARVAGRRWESELAESRWTERLRGGRRRRTSECLCEVGGQQGLGASNPSGSCCSVGSRSSRAPVE